MTVIPTCLIAQCSGHRPNMYITYNILKIIHEVFLSYFSKIRGVPNARIVSIQYQDRNVFHGTRTLDNRWIIRVAPQTTFDLLIITGIEVCNRRIAMRPYDHVLDDEYKEYMEYIKLQQRYMYYQTKTSTGTTFKEANGDIASPATRGPHETGLTTELNSSDEETA